MKVLHRDMKSANVFLMKDPSHDFYRVKIGQASLSLHSFPNPYESTGDLGVAKVLDSSTAFAQSLVGTPYYLSPELCADMPYRDKSDVWAFGVILYEVKIHSLIPPVSHRFPSVVCWLILLKQEINVH
jgi:NIMA (never in mitosis gene a)-related kinase 1/4/5